MNLQIWMTAVKMMRTIKIGQNITHMPINIIRHSNLVKQSQLDMMIVEVMINKGSTDIHTRVAPLLKVIQIFQSLTMTVQMMYHQGVNIILEI